MYRGVCRIGGRGLALGRVQNRNGRRVMEMRYNVGQKGLSGSTLKIIAIVTMIIDHVAATVLLRVLYAQGAGAHIGMIDRRGLISIYTVMRMIGRIAFPIFCFLLVEGLEHTKNLPKYILRLGLFALISEIPFDLAFSAQVLEIGYQNVFFTLFIGLLTIAAFHAVEEKRNWNPAMRIIALVCIVAAGMALAHFMCTDYAARGVMCILVLYCFRKNRIYQIIAGALAFFWWEFPALLAFIPIYFYNGTRGFKMKYVFYIIYPLHLLVLYLICMKMGIASIPVV